jgi:hypothetical protein
MSNQLKILYNNIDLFSGIGPIPFVTFSQDFIDFNTKWNQVTRLTLEGQLTGKYLGSNSNSYLNQNSKILINRLSNNYKKLEIIQNSNVLFTNDYCIIENINFDQSSWYGVLPYSIDITVYEPDLFTNFYGIVDPQEDISYSEKDNEIVNLSHKLSAKGIYNNNSALQNAKNWVLDRTNKYNKILPFLFRTDNGSNFLLDSVNETIDRFNGVYSYESNYIKSNNFENPRNSLLNYSIDINSGINDNFINFNINGNLEKSQINNLRSDYSNLNFYNIVNGIAFDTYGTYLNSKPISQSIIESPEENRLDFNIIYNNDFDTNIINDYTVDIVKNSLKNTAEVSLNANIFCKYGDVEKRWAEVKNFFEKDFNAFNLANIEYKKESNRPLSDNILTESIVFDEYNAKITYNASWSNKRKISEDIITFSSSVNYIPSIRLHANHTSAVTTREHNVQNLNCYSRSKLDVNVSIQMLPNKSLVQAQQLALSEISRIKSNYKLTSQPLLENRKINKNNNMKTLSINETWSFEGGIVGPLVT